MEQSKKTLLSSKMNQNEDIAAAKKKPRIKWWHVILVGLLVVVFSVCTFIVYCVGVFSYKAPLEVVTFTQKQKESVREFYNIPDELDVAFLKHRQQIGVGIAGSYSEVYFYLDKNDLQSYCASLTDSKWKENHSYEGLLNTVDNKDYIAISCFDGLYIHELNIYEQVFIYKSLNKDEERLLVYISQSGYVDGLTADRRGGDRYRDFNYYDYQI